MIATSVAAIARVPEALAAIGAGPQGRFESVRFDSERNALLLTGEPGTYAAQGVFTGEPIALDPGASRVSWRARWTTPLEWDRHTGNPVIVSRPGKWDETDVSTCCIVPHGDELRMFYGARDRGIGLATGRLDDLSQWRRREKPVFSAGATGAFDAGGVMSPTIVPVTDSNWFMYYVGYDPTRVKGKIKVHQIGLARSIDAGESWQRVATDPVLPLGPPGSVDGATISSNSVLKVGERWYCWYTGIAQIPYLASICLATSTDGIRWEKHPHNPVLSFNPYVETDAFMVATPHVLHEQGVFKMWFNSKGYGSGRGIGDYSIGYAESLDGVHWERCEKRPLLGPSRSGWDSTMVEYPEVVRLRDKYVMWYCGDAYRSLGYAVGRTTTRAIVEARVSDRRESGWTPWSVLDDPMGSRFARPAKFAQLRVSLFSEDPTVTPMIQSLIVDTSK